MVRKSNFNQFEGSEKKLTLLQQRETFDQLEEVADWMVGV